MFCTLTHDQVVKFYQYTYKFIRSKDNTPFTFQELAKDIYDKVYSAQKNEPLALTYLSLLPHNIFTANTASKEARQTLRDNKFDLNHINDLMDEWADISKVRDFLNQKDSQSQAGEIAGKVAAVNNPVSAFTPEADYAAIEAETINLSKSDLFSQRPDSAFASTGQETINSFSSDIDPTDTNKLLFHNTKRSLSTLKGKQNVPYDNLKLVGPDGKVTTGIRLGLVHSDSIPKDNLYKDVQLQTNPEKGVYLVVSDAKGNLLHFNEQGELASPQTGKLAITYLRSPNKTANGSYELNRKDGTSQLQSPEEIAAKLKEVEVNGKTVSDPAVIAKLIHQSQQSEFELLDKLRNFILANPSKQVTMPIEKITDGVINRDFKNPTELTKIKLDKFEPKLSKENTEDGSKRKGGVYFSIPGVSSNVLIVRPRISSEIAKTIADLAFRPNTAFEKTFHIIDYIRGMVLNDKNNLWFSVDKDTQVIKVALRYNGKMVTLGNDDASKQLLISELQKRFLNINNNFLNKKFTYLTSQDGKFHSHEMEYNDFVHNNFMTYLRPDANGEFKPLNGYIKFTAPDATDIPATPVTKTAAQPKQATKPAFTKEQEVSQKLYSDLKDLAAKVNPVSTKGNGGIQLTVSVDRGPQGRQYLELLKKEGLLNSDLSISRDGKITASRTDDIPTKLLDTDLKNPATYDNVLKIEQPSNKVDSNITQTTPTDNKLDEIIRKQMELMKAKGIDNTATEKQIKDAEEWFKNSPLSKHIELHQLFNIVNSNAIAHFTNAGITLFHGANFSDVYHEAWHGFSQMFLTQQQKVALYNEARELERFKNASDLEVEEALAEDFRKYAMSNGERVLERTPVKNNIFRRIWNFLRSLFGNKSYDQLQAEDNVLNNISELYSKLYNGQLNEYSPSITNAQFGTLNKGIEGKYYPLSNAESQLIAESFDSIIRDLQIKANRSVTQLFDSRQAKGNAFDYVKRVLELKANDPATSNYQGRLLRYALDNWKPTLDYYDRKSKYLSSDKKTSLLFDEDNNLIETHKEDGDDTSEHNLETQSRDSLGSKAGNEDSVKDMASNETLYLIAGLYQRDKEGNLINNELGFPKLVNFADTWSKLIKTLEGSLTPKEMRDKMLMASADAPELADLVQQLGSTDEHTNDLQFNMWTKFWQDMNKTRIPIYEGLIEFAQDGILFKFTEAKPNTSKVKDNFTDYFQTRLNSPYINVNKNGENVLNVPQFLADFTTKVYSMARKDLINPDGSKVAQDKIPYDLKVKADKKEEFLKALGFNFSDKEEIRNGINKIDKYGYLAKTLESLHQSGIEIASPVEALSVPQYDKNRRKLTEGESSTINNLLELEARYSDKYSNYSVINSEGNAEYEHSLNHFLTITANHVNNSDRYPRYQDLIQNPMLSRYDMDKNPLIRHSLWLNSVFKLDGQPTDVDYGTRRTNDDGSFVQLEVANFNGVKLQANEGNSEGIKTTSLDRTSKMLQDMHSLLGFGMAELPRHASKSSAFATRVSKLNSTSASYNPESHLYFPIRDFVAGNKTLDGYVFKVLKGYLSDELARIKWRLEQNIGSNIPGYSERSKTFDLFDDILKPELKSDIISGAKDVDEDKLDDYLKKYDGQLSKAFKSYFDKLVDENYKELELAPYISKELTIKVDKYLKDLGIKGMGSDADKNRILTTAFTYNAWVNNVEAIKFIYGDLDFYKTEKEEFHKRNTAYSATGTIPRTDDAALKYVGKTDNKFSTVVLKDSSAGSVSAYIDKYAKVYEAHFEKTYPNLSPAERQQMVDNVMKPYKEMKEGDAQGWITLPSYRIFKKLQGQWNGSMENLYQKVTGGEHISTKDMALLFPPVKAQYAGPIETDKLAVPGFHKFSLMPLIPGMIEDTDFKALNDNFTRQGIDYGLFESGSKIATLTKDGTLDKFYENDETRNPYQGDYTKNNIYLDYLKEQVNIEPHFKSQTIFSTQLRKLIENGMFENGKPVSEDMMRMALAYERSISKLTGLKKQELMKETGVTADKNGNYIVKDYKPLIKTLHKVFQQRDMPDNIIDFVDLDSNGKLKHPLDLSISSQKIETMLQSIVNNRLVRQKMNGEPLIQLSGAGFESLASKRNYTNPTAEDIKKWGTNDLPFYDPEGRTKKDGTKSTSAMKVKVALSGDFKHLVELPEIKSLAEKEGITPHEALNKLIKTEEWLDKDDNRKLVTMVGVRIPVQGLNSMEFMEVHHFLPEEAGNIVVPPTEIVAKSGSDFDIDKLSIFKPNIANLNGKVTRFNEQEHHASNEEIQKEYDVRLEKAEKEKDAIWKKFSKSLNNLKPDLSAEDRRAVERLQAEFKPRERELQENLDGLRAVYMNALKGNVPMEYEEFNDLLYNIEKADIDLNTLRKQYGDNVRQYIQAFRDEELSKYVGKGAMIDQLHEERRALRNSNMKAVENSIIDQIREILEHPDNFTDLVHPNDTDIVKPVADELEDRVSDYNASHSKVTGEVSRKNAKGAKIISPTRTVETRYNLYKHESNSIGKSTLGVGAIDNTFNALFNRVGAYLNNVYQTYNERKGLWQRQAVNMYFDHNKMSDGRISLSHILDAEGKNKISDVISQLMNGWVDIEKDAWIFNVNGGIEAAPVILLLNQAGVPFDVIAKFVTQKPILEYVRKMRAKSNMFAKATNPDDYVGYSWNVKKELFNDLLGTEISKKADIAKLVKIDNYKNNLFTRESLSKVITDPKEQAALLYHYLELSDVAQTLGNVKSALNFDTNKSKNIFDAQQKLSKYAEAVNNQLIPEDILNKLKNDSVISSFAVQDFSIKFWSQFMPIRNNPMLNQFVASRLKDIPIEIRNKNTDKFARVFKNDFMQYIFQNYSPVKQMNWKEMFGYPELARVKIGFKEGERDAILDSSLKRISRSDLQIPLKKGDSGIFLAKGSRFMITYLGQTKDKNHVYDIKKVAAPLGDRLVRLKEKYPELEQQYSLVRALVRNQSKDNPNLVNIRLLDAVLDTDKINVYHDEFSHLADPDQIKLGDKTKSDEITKFFKSLAAFGFLQSGLNKSPISFTEVIPQGLYTSLMAPAVKQIEENMSPGLLQDYYSKFKAINPTVYGKTGNQDSYRFKDYTSDAKLEDFKKQNKPEVETPKTAEKYLGFDSCAI